MNEHTFFTKFIKDIVFGAEDGLVSTLGIVIGVSLATASLNAILVAGLVNAVADAISMGAGTYLSDKSEYEIKSRRNKKLKPHSLKSAIVIGVSFFLVSGITILPFMIFPINIANIVSPTLSFLTLFLIGAVKTHITKRNWFKSGMEMVLIGGIAAAIGFILGSIFKV